MDEKIQYTFAVTDQVTETCEKMAAATEALEAATDKAKKSVDSQNISFLTQIAAVNTLYAGQRMLTGSIKELGLVGDETAAAMDKVNAAVGLVVGSYNMLKGAAKIVNTLKNAEVALAAVESYRAVLKNPAKLGLVAVAVGTAAGVGGYFLGKSSGGGGQSTVNQTVNFSGNVSQQNQRSLSRDSFEVA